MRLLLLLSTVAILLFHAGCAKTNSSEFASRLTDSYCPYLPSREFASSVTISGNAVYEYRVNGNGVASDGGVTLAVNSFATATQRTYSITVNDTIYSVQSEIANAQKDVVAKLKALINADSSSGLYAYGIAQITITQPGKVAPPTVTTPVLMTLGSTNPTARPIRLAEMAVKDGTGKIVQCAETDDDGSFSFQIPKDTGSYSIELRSRAANSRSNVYVLNNPSANNQHFIAKTIASDTSQTGLFFRARVHEGLLGGAFNILDQLLKAQDYLRAETADCDKVGAPTYFSGCVPFESAPIVKVYWTPGVSPSVYVGSTGSISFYLNGRHELYLQGGESGNVTSSDMDHFDNSVIVHEYAHFLEDVYGKPDSPGGSHNGDSIIDPRLAWGEGWANFFQAAVLGEPSYRDTYGTPDCTSACAGSYFNAAIDPVGTPSNDAPTPGAIGEGNFREFAVTRMLWDAIKPSGGASRFSEIWRSIVAAGVGLRDVDDPFKSIGRMLAVQSDLSGIASWSAIRSKEEQVAGFSVYATPFQLAATTCATSPVAMTPEKSFEDDGSFATSDQYRNNDFLRFNHLGGTVSLELFYSKDSANVPDLDLYLYKAKYVFGRASDMAMSSAFTGDGCPANGSSFETSNPFRAQNGCPSAPSGIASTYGYEKASAYLAAGTYMINVQADTSVAAGAPTSYVLRLNGQIICPSGQ